MLVLFVAGCASLTTFAQQTHRYTLASNQPPPLTADAGADIFSPPGEQVTLGGDPVADGGTPPYSYSWQPSGGEDPNMEVTTGDSDAAYAVTVTDDVGCTAEDEVMVFVDIPTSIAAADEIPFAIYPNPVRGKLTIETGEPAATLSLYDSKGKEIWTEALTPGAHEIYTNALPKGIYLLKVHARNRDYVMRVSVK